jgi:hypothetical protein
MGESRSTPGCVSDSPMLPSQLRPRREPRALTPELIGSGFVQVAVGRMSSCAVTRAGAVQCSGENAAGQLGLGDTRRSSVFTDLSFP